MKTASNSRQFQPVVSSSNQQKSRLCNIVSNTILYLILIVNTLQFSYWGMQEAVYGTLRDVTIGLIIALFVVSVNPTSLKQALEKSKLLRGWLICLLLFAVGSLIVYAFGANLSFGTAKDVAITLGITLIGYHKNIESRFFIGFVAIYIVLGTVSSYTYIAVFGTEIQEQYIVSYKNQLAPLFSVLVLLAISFAMHFKKSRLLMILCALLLIVVVAVLRGRTALMALFFCIALYLFDSKKLPFWSKILISIICLAFLFANSDAVYKIFFVGRDVADMDSVSSGRISRIYEGLSFLSRDNNLIVGSLWGEQYGDETVHVFLLNLWINYGGILSIPIILLYFALLGKIVQQCFRRKWKEEKWFEVTPFLILFLFIVSTNEYSYPFSPISSLLLSYLLYGAYLRQKLVPVAYARKQEKPSLVLVKQIGR